MRGKLAAANTPRREGEIMVQKARRKGYVRFSVAPNGAAQEVMLAGEFNEWCPAPMRKQKDGGFALEVKLPAGTYQYKFLIDGQWAADPDHPETAPNPHGSMNSVARVQ
ncbi:MAG: glycoside hydrolase [Planctomycetes bacterium]|nr:glycoside hydrolase [Planctomycetota bacterium]